MQIPLKWLVVAGLAGAAAPAQADYDLVVKKNCLACHSLDKRKYGPNFTEILAKYANDKTATQKLVKKIRKGGTGVWGNDVMPPQPQVSEAEAKAIVKYLLSL
ncbi:MAG: c-type cytochrome [Bradyrhizobium sp.]|uniref:c-type cytochrome n=1 Tax=Bradyrhizobium sp. TaxID=376 RepID=UPI002731920F|nr:c-type cytochrome [Bradyrhizobium sp.]MDP1867690.1 c-type cytochrome [Bradyrhizobium sp.]